ncbi:MAG: hypothetical protein HDT47_10910 [Ruminococcaceae bacterium]|nr:hypothetical protein [Oscillospiraceae bacterium]
MYKFDADGLSPVKENLCDMTGNMQASGRQRREPLIARCCLKERSI